MSARFGFDTLSMQEWAFSKIVTHTIFLAVVCVLLSLAVDRRLDSFHEVAGVPTSMMGNLGTRLLLQIWFEQGLILAILRCFVFLILL